jgi:hypothetical protein
VYNLRQLVHAQLISGIQNGVKFPLKAFRAEKKKTRKIP